MAPRNGDIVMLAHGSGGRMSRRLLDDLILPALGPAASGGLDDAACLDSPTTALALTTDSYVVDPLVFPGGNIGHLAVCGTINDLAMQGARPLALTCGLILEEGLDLGTLRTVLSTMGATAAAVGCRIVAGDTKVVERGRGSGIYINTAGLGARAEGVDVSVSRARPGDAVLVSGTLGDHGVAVMNARVGLGLSTEVVSDTAPLWDLVRPLLDLGDRLHCLRDPTRGGLAAALCDIAEAGATGIRIQESALPVRPAVRGACELLGLEPIQVANEGKAVIVCAPEAADEALDLLRGHPLGSAAARIGTVIEDGRATVVARTRIGGDRLIRPPDGELLPRIC